MNRKKDQACLNWRKAEKRKTEAKNSIFLSRQEHLWCNVHHTCIVLSVYFRTCYRLEWQYIIGNESIYRLMYI